MMLTLELMIHYAL